MKSKRTLAKTPLLALFGFLSIPNGALAETVAIKLPRSEAKVSETPFWFGSWNLKETRPVDLKTIAHYEQAPLLLTFSGAEFAYLNQQNATSVKELAPGKVEWLYSDAKVDYRRIYEVRGDSVVVDVAVSFKDKAPEKGFLNLVGYGVANDKDIANHPERSDRELFYFTDRKIERHAIDDTLARSEVLTPLKWAGVGSRYFLLAVFPEETTVEKMFYEMVPDAQIGETRAQASFQLPVTDRQLKARFKVAFADKKLETLKAIDPSLDVTVDLGFFSIIAYPILQALRFIYKFTGNYGFAIIILTILIKILTFPLVVKSMKGMKRMAEFQPKMKALQEKHKDDKAALNMEMMQLMKQSGYNPMAGCFPMLLQMPIFFALYRVLYSAEELFDAPFAFWIHDLSAKDPLFITPVAMTLIMFLQQKLTPPSPGMDPAQRKMMMFMPLMFGGFMLTTPAGLCVYMLVNSVFSVLQQQYLNKKLGVPSHAAGMATSF
jgi:YidC/Oxa1 family membrane protein insertase